MLGSFLGPIRASTCNLAVRGWSRKEEATAFEEEAGDKYADLNELFLDSSEMDSDNDASEEDMKVRYTYLMPKESDVSVEFNSVKTLLFENQIEDISKTLHQVRKERGIKEGEELDDPNMLLNAFLDPVQSRRKV